MPASHDPTRTIPPGGTVDATRDPDPGPTGHAAPDPDATTDGPYNTAGTSPTPPSTGRYVFAEELAAGGMGVVYRASDTVLGREVAVKVLRDKFNPDSGTARRFLDEARITGQLQHPNIPAVHDMGVLSDGRPFLAMKLIKGQTLDCLLAARPDPAHNQGRFVAAFEQVCQAVAYAHAHGVVHRDLKPANVMVGAFGEVQVMDWGLAKVLKSRAEESTASEETAPGTAVVSLREADGLETRAGSVLGTPAFMPPEQAVGAVDTVDMRSDVFGLGAVLAVVLTGQAPFVAGSSESTRVMAAQGDVVGCFARLDGCGADPGVVALAKRCLAPRPEDRPADAGEVARAVAALRAEADERARRAELDRVKAEGERAAAEEQRKRRRVQAVLAGSLGLLLIVGGLGIAIANLWRAAEEARGKAVGLQGEAEAAQGQLAEVNAALRREQDHLAALEYGRTMHVAYQEWCANNVAATLMLLESTRPELRGWEWQFVHRLCHSDLVTLNGHTSAVWSAAISPDGTRIVTGSADDTAKVWDAKSGAELLTLKGHTKGVRSAEFSRDGTRIVTGSEDHTAKVWDAKSGAELLTLRGHADEV
ncbi:MAG: serine/threonine-protein kinase [Gemmataceae bacterium]